MSQPCLHTLMQTLLTVNQSARTILRLGKRVMGQRGNLRALAGKCDGTSVKLFLDVVIKQKSNSWDVSTYI